MFNRYFTYLKVLACLPQTLPWNIPEEELTSRRDLRDLCIFTIDPATARDLDDALSCVPVGNGWCSAYI